jgi:hypothetical protein
MAMATDLRCLIEKMAIRIISLKLHTAPECKLRKLSKSIEILKP